MFYTMSACLDTRTNYIYLGLYLLDTQNFTKGMYLSFAGMEDFIPTRAINGISNFT